MAHKRMFSKDITESDAFSDMPLSTQALYFHLGMGADDDGFINNPKKIQRGIGASADDLNLLIAKRFLIAFPSGVVVVKHWRINNAVRQDRKVGTKYTDEMSQLILKDNGAYSLVCGEYCSDQAILVSDDTCLANAGQMPGKCPSNAGIDIGEDRIVEDRDILSGKPDHAESVREIVSYLNSVTGSSYKPTTKKTSSLIRARFNEGFTVDDFKAVIDRKSSDWLNDAKMRRYLRPETLFGTKFEGYLNEGRVTKNGVGRYSKYR